MEEEEKMDNAEWQRSQDEWAKQQEKSSEQIDLQKEMSELQALQVKRLQLLALEKKLENDVKLGTNLRKIQRELHPQQYVQIKFDQRRLVTAQKYLVSPYL